MVGRSLGLGLGLLLILVGGVWTCQGLGYLDGSFMTGSRTWATIGPITAGFGLALVIVVIQRARGR